LDEFVVTYKHMSGDKICIPLFIKFFITYRKINNTIC